MMLPSGRPIRILSTLPLQKSKRGTSSYGDGMTSLLARSLPCRCRSPLRPLLRKMCWRELRRLGLDLRELDALERRLSLLLSDHRLRDRDLYLKAMRCGVSLLRENVRELLLLDLPRDRLRLECLPSLYLPSSQSSWCSLPLSFFLPDKKLFAAPTAHTMPVTIGMASIPDIPAIRRSIRTLMQSWKDIGAERKLQMLIQMQAK